MNVALSDVEKVPDSWSEFFWKFSRMEFALKESKFLRSEKKGSRAEADWEKFAKTLPTEFFDEVKKHGDLRILFDAPPKKQIIGQFVELMWQDQPEPTDAWGVLQAVKTVRNNLFHGGKHRYPDEERNEALIAASLSLIELALSHHENVAAIFSRKY